jgi:hypothetical protein
MTISIPNTLYLRLRIAAEQQEKTLSAVACELIDQALTVYEKAQSKRIYEGLERLKGSDTSRVTNASTTINEILYGENGAWRGHKE